VTRHGGGVANYADATRSPRTMTEREHRALLKVTADGAADRRGGRASIAPVWSDMGRVVGNEGQTAINMSVRPGTSEIITAFPVP
jgi:hypothetical protein